MCRALVVETEPGCGAGVSLMLRSLYNNTTVVTVGVGEPVDVESVDVVVVVGKTADWLASVTESLMKLRDDIPVIVMGRRAGITETLKDRLVMVVDSPISRERFGSIVKQALADKDNVQTIKEATTRLGQMLQRK